ncbi:uncharacterized protein PHALS_02597 [Plasmopara halstedii]|uniref:Uncharacterized protein n=1 Tax=Plasmopara halstedii TaxID=4781 RepID=A0A0P1AZ94_PLAHL|nr:uncharacterized protein PHALS_02597 [Plasmopara halstedii]CEG46182.1 hypothetical protein PHALS_02597 [Plasmopara halstedii]|eukprot:XP_024582551.1 hypothetical protein PHALS_02597 [Plasmopara halstedii]
MSSLHALPLFSYWNGLSASYVPKYVRKQPRCTSMVGLYFILKIQSSTKDYISKHSVSDMELKEWLGD